VSRALRPHNDVLARAFEGKLVLLHLGTGEYFTLNAIGATVWNSLGSGATEPEITSRVCATYETTEEEAARDVGAFLEMLTANGLILATE